MASSSASTSRAGAPRHPPSMSRVNLTNVQTVCCVARTGSFAAAAKKLYTTPSTISARVKELESSLGFDLFARTARKAVLTVRGREFVDAAEPLVLQFEGLIDAFEPARGMAGRIRIGVAHICMTWFPEAVREARQQMRNLFIDLETGMTGRLLQRLESGDLDLAVVSGPMDFSKFHVTSLGIEAMGWFVSPSLLEAVGHEIVETLPQPSEAGLSLWSMPRHSYYFANAFEPLRTRGYSVRQMNSSSDIAVILGLVLGKAGIGMLPEEMVRRYVQSGQVLQVFRDCPLPPIELFLARRREHTHPAVERIMRLTTELRIAIRAGSDAVALPSRRLTPGKR
ncbi:MAG: LysR family transcriptional regulator [Lautropia sp.]